METIECTSSKRSFGGEVKFYKHFSSSCQCEMNFSIFIPPDTNKEKRRPVLYWLSGLECTEKNFMEKSGVQKYAADHGIIIVAPDTSPRGCKINGEDEFWYFGTSAGFYVNATEEKWKKNYNMYDYVVEELPALISKNFPENGKKSISGHSMGGHGAMMIALRNPEEYISVSAFAPVSAPMQCPWGIGVFTGYLGEDKESWKKYDSSYLVQNCDVKIPILIDVGGDDPFLKKQLKIDIFEKCCAKNDYPLTINICEGYDHSYYFVASFIGDHIEYHAEKLRK